MRYFTVVIIVFGLAFSQGCTRHHVKVETEEPIMIRVEARIDIYNHAAEIEDMVSGKRPIELREEEGDRSFFFPDPFTSSAYAGDDRILRKAIARRKARYGRVQELRRRGIAGESALGYLEIRSHATPAQKRLIKKENEDRKIIYIETAREKKIPLLEVRRSFANILKKRSGAGVWIETERGWVRK